MAYNLVQHRTAAIANAATSASLAFTSPAVVNNRAIASVAIFPNGISISSITDNGSTPNSYNTDESLGDATVGAAATAASANIAKNPSSGNLQVTFSFTSGVSGGDIQVEEVSGLQTALDIRDVHGNVAQTTAVASASVSSSGSSVAAGEYCYGVFTLGANPTGVAGASGTTLEDSDQANGSAFCDKSSLGGVETVNLSWTTPNSNYVGLIVVYKLLPAGGGQILYAYTSN